MSKTMTEFFNGGVVTSRVGALLNSGELQRADDCVYREKDPAIWRAPGRTAYNATAITVASVAQKIKGLGYLTFGSGFTDQLLVSANKYLYRSDYTAITGSFTEVSSPNRIVGTVSTLTTFTATGGNVFTADVVGARVYGTTSTNGPPTVTATSGAADADGRYAAVVVSQTITGTTRASFEWGIILELSDAGTEILGHTRWEEGQYFIWNSANDIRRVSWRRRGYSGGSPLNPVLVARPCGLSEVVTAPTVTTTAGTWSLLLESGIYWFLITEIYAPGGDVAAAERDPALASEIIESAYLGVVASSNDPNTNKGRPIPVSLTKGGTTVPVITFPAVVNDGTGGRLATNWGIYMYGPTATTTDVPSLALFRRVAAPAITDVSKTLTESSLSPQFKYPATVAAGFGATALTNPSRITGAPDGIFTGTDTLLGTSGDTPGHAARVSNFSFDTTGGYATAAVLGIEVTVKAAASSADAFIDVQVSTAGGKKGPIYVKDFRHALFSPVGLLTVGGPTDTMAMGLLIGDLATLQVDVGIEGSAISFDSVKVTLYFAGATVNLTGPAYRVVTYRDQVGNSLDEPANLPPPICSTADVWNGSLVMNDIFTDGAVRYSLPGRPESVPKPYILKFRDRSVNFIRNLGQMLVVGLRDVVKRVNYLPRETDTDLTTGLAQEDIAPDHGIPGPFCGVKFDMPGKGAMLAYVSTVGVFLTNGIWTIPLNLDLDWANTVKISALSTAVFKVYPKEKWLALYYCPAGATHNRNTRVMYFTYQADKIKGEYQLPMVGPCVVSGRAVAETKLVGTDYLLTGQETDGKVYVEDNGLTVPSGYQVTLTATSSTQGDGKASSGTDVMISPSIRSRKFYPINLDRDGYGEKVYLMFSAYGSNSVTASSTLTAGNTTITSAAAFGSVLPGMRVLGTGMDPGTIVVSKSNSSTIVVSRAPNTSGSSITLTFDTGTLGIGIRGSSLGENVKGLSTNYVSTLAGDLVDLISTNFRRGFELQVEKVPLTFDSNGDTLTSADLSTNMRLHTITYVTNDDGLPDSNRNAA